MGLVAVIKHCLYCKWEKAGPVTPFMADDLSNRLCFNEKPFTKTEVQYLGLYQIKLSKGTRPNQAAAKRYSFIQMSINKSSPSRNCWRYV